MTSIKEQVSLQQDLMIKAISCASMIKLLTEENPDELKEYREAQYKEYAELMTKLTQSVFKMTGFSLNAIVETEAVNIPKEVAA
jgi:hypothetical protein